MLTHDNTTGYTDEQLLALNVEFTARVNAGYYDECPEGEAEKSFADEVSRR